MNMCHPSKHFYLCYGMLLSESDIEADFLCSNSDKYIEVNMDKAADVLTTYY